MPAEASIHVSNIALLMRRPGPAPGRRKESAATGFGTLEQDGFPLSRE